METVGVFIRINRCQQRTLVETSRQGKLQQDPIHTGIGIERRDCIKHLLLGAVLRQMGSIAGHADAGAGLLLIGHVDTTGGVIADPQHREAGRTARLRRSGRDLLA